MSFLWIKLLWLLLLVPVLVTVYILAQRRRKKYALRYSNLLLVKQALGRGPGIRRHIPPVLFLIAIAIMIIALARPVATVLLPSQQATVILAIDNSGSMRANDIKPNRMEAAKSAARLFVEKQPANVRIGIVSFSGSAAIVQAPTKDREMVLASINRLSSQTQTAIGRGIQTSLNAIFEDADTAPASSDPLITPGQVTEPAVVPPGSYTAAAIVLLSDGVNNTGPLPLEIVNEASDRGVRVYTVGLGSPEEAVLKTQGRGIRMRLDEETLKTIAVLTGACYFNAKNEYDLSVIYENLSTNLELKPEQTEITAWLTGLGTVLLLVAGTLSLLWFSRLR